MMALTGIVAAERSSVLVILTDDQGWVSTPDIDQLRGMAHRSADF